MDKEVEVSNEEAIDLEEKRNNEWEEFIDSVVSEYKNTATYESLIDEIRVCRKLTSGRKVTKQEVINAYRKEGLLK